MFLGICELWWLSKIEEFDSSQASVHWEARVLHRRQWHRKHEKEVHCILLTLIWAMYKLLCSLVAPSKPDEKTYQELIQALTAHFSPTPSPIVQIQVSLLLPSAGWVYCCFVSQLCSLSENCGFGDTLEDMLRLVCGICNRMQSRSISWQTQFCNGCTARTVNGDSCKECKGVAAALRTPTTSTGSHKGDSAQTRKKDSPHLPSLWQDWS